MKWWVAGSRSTRFNMPQRREQVWNAMHSKRRLNDFAHFTFLICCCGGACRCWLLIFLVRFCCHCVLSWIDFLFVMQTCSYSLQANSQSQKCYCHCVQIQIQIQIQTPNPQIGIYKSRCNIFHSVSREFSRIFQTHLLCLGSVVILRQYKHQKRTRIRQKIRCILFEWVLY